MPYIPFDSWEEACRASKFGKAVGSIYIEHKGRTCEVEIVKSMFGQPEIMYKGSAVKIRNASTREVDLVAKWRPF